MGTGGTKKRGTKKTRGEDRDWKIVCTLDKNVFWYYYERMVGYGADVEKKRREEKVGGGGGGCRGSWVFCFSRTVERVNSYSNPSTYISWNFWYSSFQKIIWLDSAGFKKGWRNSWRGKYKGVVDLRHLVVFMVDSIRPIQKFVALLITICNKNTWLLLLHIQ